MQGETAKPPDFYSIVSHQCFAHLLDDAANRQFHIFPLQMRALFSQNINEFRFSHVRSCTCLKVICPAKLDYVAYAPFFCVKCPDMSRNGLVKSGYYAALKHFL